MFKVNNKNTRTRGEICSKLTIKNQNDASGVNFEHTSQLVSIVKFEQVNKCRLDYEKMFKKQTNWYATYMIKTLTS